MSLELSFLVYLAVIDAWGKPPAGFTRGRLKWPGEMNQCIRIKANRTTVKPDGTVIEEVDGIKGAWSMVSLKLDFIFGDAGVSRYLAISFIISFPNDLTLVLHRKTPKVRQPSCE